MTASASPSPPVDLKDPYTATLLSLVFPGLGHLYQGRVAKGILFALCVGGLFLLGAYIGSSAKFGPCRVVYFSLRSPEDMRYYFFGQVWIGLPAAPALLQYMVDPTGQEPILGGLMAPPILKSAQYSPRGVERRDYQDPNLPTSDNIRQYLNRNFELGTIFTVVAGLLNIFVLLDAYSGPFPEKEEENEGKENDKNDKSPDFSEKYNERKK